MHWDIDPILKKAEEARFDLSQAKDQIRDLAKVIEISKSVSAEKDLDTLFEMIVNSTSEVLNCERTTLFLVDEEREELFSKVAEKAEIKEIRFPLSKGLSGYCATHNEAVDVEDAYSDPRFNKEIDVLTGYHTKSILCFPLSDFTGRVVGVLQALNKKEGVFTEYDKSLLAAFSHQAAIALDNAKLAQAYLEREKLKKSLEIARDIQRSLLPSQHPAIEGLEIFATLKTCEETGGDYYDFLPISSHKYGLAIGDVSGHGIGAALFMSMARVLLRTFAKSEKTPESVLTRMNNPLEADMGESFLTLFYAVLDTQSWKLRYASAGHDEPIIIRKSGEVEMLTATALPLGMLPDIEVDGEKDIVLKEGDVLVLSTDGIWVAANPEGEQFGRTNFVNLLKEIKDLPAGEIVKTIEQTVKDKIAPADFHDDYTLVIIKFIKHPQPDDDRFIELDL